MTRTCVGCAFLLSAGIALSASTTAAQKLEITPAQIMSDEVATIRVTGVQPSVHVTLHAQLIDGAEQSWSSEAEFLADSSGMVDTSKQAPLKGSYKPVSAMGLVWSMMPASRDVAGYRAPPDSVQAIEFSASVDGKRVATTALTERFHSDAVKRIELNGALHGFFFIPDSAGPHPGILVVGGSEGGAPQAKAEWLARHGYAALALAYFRFEGLPATLEDIPLEYFGQALAWMMKRPEIIPNELAVMGSSRGGELALQLGAIYPQIQAVVAYVPANVRYPSCCGMMMRGAWTVNGRELAYAMPRNAGGLEGAQAAIAVEKIQGPILVISAQDDGVWPSSAMTSAIEHRLKQSHFAHEFVRLDYPHAGHRAGNPVFEPAWAGEVRHPVSGRMVNMGGTPEGNALSSLDATPKVLDFLKRSLPAAEGTAKAPGATGN